VPGAGDPARRGRSGVGRDLTIDRKDWDAHTNLHTDDYVAISIGAEPIDGGRAAADALAVRLADGIRHGGRVRVWTDSGEITPLANVSDAIRCGVASIMRRHENANANLLTSVVHMMQ
jgi:hypothetical protein